MTCANCGRQNDDAARFCQTCGQPLTAPPRAVSAVSRYGGFWERFAAIVLDWVIISVGFSLLAILSAGILAAPGILIPWLYEALMTSSEKQATLGKMALGLVVTDLDGRRISFGRATGRHFAKYLSALVLFVGFIMAAFTERKQALHDMIADTLVVRREP